MSFGAPSPPDASATASAQQGYNTSAAKAQQKINMINQTTPYGSLTYTKDANSPGGYDANTVLSPAEQQLLQTQQATQQTLGTAGSNLASATAGMYSGAPRLNTQDIAKELNQWQQSYLQPIFDQQQSNTNARLQNQGLAPGSAAYDNAQNLLARNHGDVTNQYLSQNEGQAYNQAVQNYELPAQMATSLMNGSAPQSPAFQQTPTAQVQPANYAGLAEQNYAQQNTAYGQQLQGMFGIPTALAGGWARGGFQMPA